MPDSEYKPLCENDIIQTADQYQIGESPWIEVSESIGKSVGDYPERTFRRPKPTENLSNEDKKYDPKLMEWHSPLWEGHRTLREVYEELVAFGNNQDEVPWIVQLIENPRFHFGGLGFFKGRVTLKQHDYLHILLGRGTMLADEAFVIGFTMGSTDKVGPLEQTIFNVIVDKLYPQEYRFSEIGKRIFKDAIALAWASDCKPLETVDFEPMLDWPIKKIREAVGIETDLLQAYYAIEARRYPKSRASQRLVLPHPGPELEALIEDGLVLENNGVKLYKDLSEKEHPSHPYHVSVEESILKGIQCAGQFSTLLMAYDCFQKRLVSLREESTKLHQQIMGRMHRKPQTTH